MLPNSFDYSGSDSLKQKAREISYALLRVSFYIKNSDLRQRLSALSFEFLENSAIASVDSGDSVAINRVLKNISALDVLVRLGYSIYDIEPINATVLVREIDSFNSAMRQFGNFDGKLCDIESMFSKTPLINGSISKKEDVKINQPSVNIPSKQQEDSDSAKTRHSAIIELIKSGNEGICRLKDLIAAFPKVSERTLRYDLQKLCEQGEIERVGNGGPASHYRIKG